MAETNECKQWQDLRASKPAIPYLLYYPSLREVARQHGYALAIHGSLTRDFDLIAVPWTPDASDVDTLVEAMCAANQLIVTVPDKGDKPHGRKGYTIQGIADVPHGWVDLSVLPPTLLRKLTASLKPCRCGHDAGSHDRSRGYCRATRDRRRNPCGCRAFSATPTPKD